MTVAVQAYLDARRFVGNYQYNYLNSLAPGAGPGVGRVRRGPCSQNKVWAVIDHNSSFAAGNNAVVPEPSVLLILLAGGGSLLTRHRRA